MVTVAFETCENWHNYGRLKPGPDYERYREPLEQLLAAQRASDALYESDELIPDAELDRAEDRKEHAEQVVDQFVLYLEDAGTRQVTFIHDFHLEDDQRGVYWRFGKLPAPRVAPS